LNTLILSSNSIDKIDSHSALLAWRALSSWTCLVIQLLSLHRIRWQCWNGSRCSRSISIKLTSINSDMLSGLDCLERFSATFNEIVAVEPDTFAHLAKRHMLHVDVSYNDLGEIDERAFNGLDTKLFLSCANQCDNSRMYN
jgi:hypothetical protein